MLRRVASAALAAAVALGPLAAAARPAATGRADFSFDWLGRVAEVARGLDDPDPNLRYEAVQKLGGMEIAWTREHLLRALRDDSDRVRSAAAKLLAQAGVREAIPIVLPWLTSGEKASKQAAADVLGALADPATVPHLVRSLADPEPDVRVAAVAALGAIGGERVLVPLIGRLEDDKAEVRQAAVRQLMELGDQRAVIPLAALFNDSSRDVRMAAVTAVGRLGDRAAVPALRRLLRDPEEAVKLEVIGALGNLRAVEATDLLIAQLGAGSDTLRARAAFSLGQVARAPDAGRQGDAALAALIEALSSGQLRGAAREALLAAGPAAVPALTDYLGGRLDGDPATAILLLRDLGDRRATPALIAELDRGRVNKELVLDALARLGDRRALVPVLGLLGHDDAAVRLHAMRALRPLLGGAGPAAGDILVDLLGDPELEIRVLAAEYLGRLEARAAAPRLVELAAGATELRLRAAAIWALGQLWRADDPGGDGAGRAAATRVLLDVLRQGPPALHLEAANALIFVKDDRAVAPLIALARDDGSPSRATVVRALGGLLRDRPHEAGRRLLEDLATAARLPVSLAALGALSAMRDPAARPALVAIVGNADLERRRAALEALGNLRDRALMPRLIEELEAADDGVAATAAWALGKLGDRAAVPALRRAMKRGSFATPINASAAIALVADARDQAAVLALLDHRSRWVRTNGAAAAGRLALAAAEKPLARMLDRDPSWVARAAAARALSRLGKGKDALERAAESDGRDEVRAAAKAALAGRFAPPPRDEWANFYFVDPTSGDARVKMEPYVVVAADGIATALYTDARGEAAEEWFPAGEAMEIPRSQEREY